MKTRSASSLLLTELIFSVLFFILAASVCVQLFARAAILSDSTAEKNKAVLLAETRAEEFYAAGGHLESRVEYYSKNFEEASSEEDAAYSMTVASAKAGSSAADTSLQSPDTVCKITVTKLADASEIYTLDLFAHDRRQP